MWKPNECNVYVRNYSTLSKLSGLQQFINVPFNTPIKLCDHGWHFDRSDYISTVVTEVRNRKRELCRFKYR